jgi:hypothetical protein
MEPVPRPPLDLCPACRHVRRVTTPRSVFLLCERSRDDPRYERYPRQPVRECPGYEATVDDETPPGSPGRGPHE